MKPIPTAYDGYEFRSRTEARHALLFNELGVRYDYEPEGFDLDGEWYLPDFYLPDLGMWVEVKGKPPTEVEFLKATKLALASGETTVISWGRDSISLWTDECFHSKRGIHWLPTPQSLPEIWETIKRIRF